ncbi:hypothetical protein KUTeg_004887 [Tegillarca granosa]|uniref:M-phase inducer phosphatase n=1 Tax=Tegillarca granosa TaxID=220873 RepID=A0ABQ9FI70_TEGGR|nr:hypothetical protein KUTeg_004887 [Tegillarca granosa]
MLRKRPASKLRKTLSYGDEPREHDVQAVVDRLAEEEDLASDGSGSYRLPTITGKHRDLKNISNTTVKNLIEGKYHDTISDYKIIDCRYPYEYEGGHVQGAENIYTREAMSEFLNRHNTNKKTILIFYCEFSSERGTKMCRYLREKDRELNSENYPALNYPEIYLMYGGYKDLFQNHKEVCEPMEYKPMLHADHADDLRYFRAKTKFGTAAEKKRKGSRLRF